MREFPKKTILLKTGQVENYLSFVEKGTIRFYIDNEENELTFDFIFANGFVSAYDSFLSRRPSSYQVQTLTDSILWRVTHKDLQDIYRETKIRNRIGRHGLVYLTGIAEVLAAIGLCLPRWKFITGCTLIIFFILLLPANIYGAVKHVDLEKANYNGHGLTYLWFRVPMQLFFIAWVYFSAIWKPFTTNKKHFPPALSLS